MSFISSLFSGPPKPPDQSTIMASGTQLTNQQQAANQQAATQGLFMNAMNQNNPFGFLNYTQTGTGPGGVPIFSASQGYNPTQQNILDIQNYYKTLAGATGTGMLANANYTGSTPTQAIGDMTSGLTGQMMGGWLQSQLPFFTTQTQQLDTQLRNQGLGPETEAYKNAMRQLTTNQANAVSGAASGFEPSAFNQATNLYQMPMNMGMTMAGMANPASLQGTWYNTPTTNLQPPNAIGAYSSVEQGMMDAYKAQAQQYSDALKGATQLVSTIGGGLMFGPAGAAIGSGLGAVGSNLLMGSGAVNPTAYTAGAGLPYATPWNSYSASDRRLKRDIEHVGEVHGHNIYRYKHHDSDDEHFGVMADEVEKKRPDAVAYDENGYGFVNYAKLFGPGNA